MRVERFHVAIGCGLVTAALVAWHFFEAGGQSPPGRPNDQAPGESATIPVPDAGPPQTSPAYTVETPGVSADSESAGTSVVPQLPLDELIALQAERKLLPSRVARFDAVTESELIRRYRASQSAREKYDLAHLLAYGGGTATIALFTNALFHEFVGKPLDDPWEPILIRALPGHLGILAGREDAALDVLLSGVRGQLDLRQRAWETGQFRLEEEVLRGAFWNGLGWSGRAEARQLFTEVLSGHSPGLTKDVESAVISSAFDLRIVESHGLDEMVRLGRDLSGEMDEYRRWKHSTEEGRAWNEWFYAHSPDVRPGTRPSTHRRP